MRLFHVISFLAITVSSSSQHTSFCDHIHDLPPECICQEDTAGPLSFVVSCEKPFESYYFNDTLGIELIVSPCDAMGSSVSLDITELDHNIHYQITGIRAGEDVNYPIPGLSVVVPGIGHVGIDADVLIYGNPDLLTLKIGLNACASVRNKQVCASAIPGLNTILPWWILKGSYSFGNVCNSTRVER